MLKVVVLLNLHLEAGIEVQVSAFGLAIFDEHLMMTNLFTLQSILVFEIGLKAYSIVNPTLDNPFHLFHLYLTQLSQVRSNAKSASHVQGFLHSKSELNPASKDLYIAYYIIHPTLDNPFHLWSTRTWLRYAGAIPTVDTVPSDCDIRV